jgi:hypothetical protein
MDFDFFITSLSLPQPPVNLSPALRALWFDKNGDWDRAHEEIQHEPDPQSAAVHAYLHRKEGDLWNSRYWYRTAQRREFSGSIEHEWEALAREFLRDSPVEVRA